MSATRVLDIVDSHVHWRDPGNNPYQLIMGEVPEPGQEREGIQAKTYLPEQYFDNASTVNIDGVVHIEAEWDLSDPVGESRWLSNIQAAGMLDDRALAIVGFADLLDPKVHTVLETHAGFPLVKGIRQILNYLPGRPEYCWAKHDYLASDVWRANYAQLARYELDFDLMCFAHQMPAMAQLAHRHPDIRIHLEHAGLPWDHSQEGRHLWRQGMQALAEHDNIDVKISGLGNTITDWTIGKIRPYVLDTIDIFGVERASFASNFPTDAQFSDMGSIWHAFDVIVADFSDHERQALFRDNALRHYGFDRFSKATGEIG